MVQEILDGFLADGRLTWRQQAVGADGGFPCIWDWKDASGGEAKEPMAPCDKGGGALRSEAVKVLRRGLGELLNEAEGGHEMTSAYAGVVASLLLSAAEQMAE
jgi:hypothetical protein